MHVPDAFSNCFPDVEVLSYLFWHPHRSRRERTSLAMTESSHFVIPSYKTHTQTHAGTHYKTYHYDMVLNRQRNP